MVALHLRERLVDDGVTPPDDAQAALADGRLRQVLPDCQPQVRFGQHLYACYTPSRVQLPKVQVFLAALEDLLQPEPPWRKIWPGPG